jgi:polar amino acid transport system substrate-binding protein
VKKRIFLLLLLSTPISATQKVTLGIPVFPPHSILDEVTNECVGPFVTITKKILAEYAINIDVFCAPPIRIYRLLEKAKVDFTINIKSTKALPKDIVFVETPFSTLNLDLYTHQNTKSTMSVAAIRGFSYHGFRKRLMVQGYEFFELPNSISAIQLFLKKRTSHLISYRSPVDYYIQEKKLNIKDDISVLPLLDVPTYYAISGQSPFLEKLQTAFDDYASRHQLTFFDELN